MNTNPQLTRKLFLEALELPTLEQAEFIEQKCGGNEKLKQKLIALLQSDNKIADDGFLERPAFDEDISTLLERFSSDALLGSTIGQYKIIKRLNSGGMGDIYLAERADRQFEKQVALKIIRRGMNSTIVIERFFLERRILAGLEHPNIARLIDAGMMEDRMPYFVMEYVEGVPVDEFYQQEKLSLADKLKIFRTICAAVSYAHQNLIIHRDLKPANILITKAGTPKLLDFGIAKLLTHNDQSLTQTDFRILTPAYASPEQLRGEHVTTATDIYSLGVLLYELLTGIRPNKIQTDNYMDFVRQVSETDPARPSAIIEKTSSDTNPKSLRGDLDNIIIKSLKKDPLLRYSSVEQFSEDIRRHLENLPVLARPETIGYRVEKFLKRYRTVVYSSIIVLIILAGGLAISFWQFRNAQLERARAERRFNDVRALVNTFLSELNDEMLKVPGTTPARKLLVQHTLEYLNNASQESGGDAALQRELATAYNKIGDIQGNAFYQNLGDMSGALSSYQKSLTIRQQLLKEDPANAGIKLELAQVYESTGDVIWSKGDLKAVLENYQQAIKLVEELSAATPDDVDLKLYLARLYTSLADVKYGDGSQNLRDMPGSLADINKALVIREQLFDASPSEVKFRIALKGSYRRLCEIYRLSGDFPRSMEYLSKTQTLVESLLAGDPSHPGRKRDVAVTYAELVTAFIYQEEFDNARLYAEKSIAIREELARADPSDIQAQQDLAYGYSSRGTLRLEMNESLAALADYHQQLKISTELFSLADDDKAKQLDLVDALINVGNALIKTGNDSAALAQFDRAFEINKSFPADDGQAQSNAANIESGRAAAKLAEKNWQMSIETFKVALALRENEAQNDSLNVLIRADIANLYFNLGNAYENIPDKPESLIWYQKSLNVWKTLQEQNALRKIDLRKFNEVLHKSSTRE